MSKAQQLEQKHHFQTYNRFPVTIEKGEGAVVWDTDGTEYIDALGGIAVNNLGHCHPKVVRAIQQQAAQLMHVSNFYYTEQQGLFVKKLAKIAGLPRVFLCNSGVEAMEGCVKLARKWAKKKGKTGPIFSLQQGFHGRSVTTITMGMPGYQKDFDPLAPGFEQTPFNDFDALQAAVDENTIAIAFEPVQGSGGVNVISQEFMTKVRALCDELEILLIIDEVQTGVCRTGKFFAYEHFGIQPDVVAAAKALAGGIPVGAIMAKEEVASALGFGDHGTTFGGNPLVAAAGIATLEAIEEEALCQQATDKGDYMMKLLHKHLANHPLVQDIRGLGLMIGVELYVPARPVVDRMFERKVLSNAASGKVIRLLPPLVISKNQIERVVDALTYSLEHNNGNS